jgi:hypothetical protein
MIINIGQREEGQRSMESKLNLAIVHMAFQKLFWPEMLQKENGAGAHIGLFFFLIFFLCPFLLCTFDCV